MTDLEKRLESLSPEKRALVLKKLQEKVSADKAQAEKISVRSDPATYPLSYAQQRMWFLNQWEPDNPFYNITAGLKIQGKLDKSIFESSVRAVIDRHEILRSYYKIGKDGYPEQAITDDPGFRLTEIELNFSLGAEVEPELMGILLKAGRTSFDLTKPPLLRVLLIQSGIDEYHVLFTIHHIVADGGSIGILIREIAMLYSAYSQNKSDPLPEMTIQYADYAAWQRTWMEGEILEEQLNYWKEIFETIPSPLELPTDRSRPVVQTFSGSVETITIPADTRDALRSLGNQNNASLFMVLLTTFYVLLYRYSGQEDICIGTPVSNRTRTELENIIGLFVNTLALRSELDGHMSFIQLLDQVRETALSAYAYQDLPFEILVDELGLERDLSRTPLYQVMFALQDAPLGKINLPTLEISQLDFETGTAKFDLTLFIEENPRGLKAMMEYNTDLFDADTIKRMLRSFQLLLTGIAHHPEEGVAYLPILNEQEYYQIVESWNETSSDYPSTQNLVQIFEAQVEKSPDKLALVDGDQALTYRELNERANQLGNYLRNLGVVAEELVGIYMERSWEMVVATLGIMKAGGAYLPLDLSYPAERLSFILTDGQVRFLLTELQYLQDLNDLDGSANNIHLICLDADWEQISRESIRDLDQNISIDNLAYLMYTSGSTGIPKGVSITQRSIIRLLFNTNYIEIDENDVFVHASNPSFDAATFEIWGAFLFGAKLVVVPRDVTLSPGLYAEFLKRNQISVMFITTALFNHIVKEVPDAFQPVENVLYGGEAADVEMTRVAFEQSAPKRLLNVYGPTESTTFTTWNLIKKFSKDSRSVPIGSPVSNTTTYVLDKFLQPVPIGVPGELFIGGDGLARDYHRRPKLTAERFVPNPFAKPAQFGDQSKGNPTRLYKTGDLVRYLPDGEIEFIGRVDFQVKLRGLRIELGEIETILSRHPSINESIVILREDTPGDKRLVAYVVLKSGESIATDEIRNFLKQRLPEFMIPASIVILESFPLNPNGKIDRGALPMPDRDRPDLAKAYIPATTPIERYLTKKWQQVLGLEKIGIYDNFFELGGDSLKAAVLINRLQEEFGEHTHVKVLFLAPTIAEMAVYINEYYPSIAAQFTPGETGELSTLDQIDSRRIFKVDQSIEIVHEKRLTSQDVQTIRKLINRGQKLDIGGSSEKNPPAIFVLSPPRSGSTLLRTMLAGHSRLFAPPELDLLSFDTLDERRDAFSEANRFWLEGVIRAIMEIKDVGAEEAEEIMHQFETQGMAIQDFYLQLQTWLGNKLLVDKTPVYALNINTLERMERYFENPFYIHLTRHPYGSIYSFVEAKLDQVFFRYEHPFSRRELAELVWIVSHQNIIQFLENVPQERQIRASFEDLVTEPERVMDNISQFIGIPFMHEMLEPYDGDRMTSSVTPDGQMVGDFKFYLRKSIDPRAAHRWKKFHAEDFLSDVGLELAKQLHYEVDSTISDRTRQAIEKIEPVPRNGKLPLSFAQQRLWFLDQWEPGSHHYNVPSGVRLRGPLSIESMHESINQVVARHEVLRTRYLSDAGKPVLIIDEHKNVPMPIIDLSKLPEDMRISEAMRIAQKEVLKPFNLAEDLMLRAFMLKLGDEDHILVLSMHHIASDGWSISVIIREIAVFYAAFIAGEEPLVDDLPIQYVDYAAWQREWLEGTLEQKQLEYWKGKLADSPKLLELPTDRPRPSVLSQRGSQKYFELPDKLSLAIRKLSSKEEKTLFMTLLAAFQALLYRYTGQHDICVGTPVANRMREEIEPLIGFFVNTLVLRADLSGDPSFLELLERAHATSIEAFEHQDIPFEHLVDQLHVERSMSHTPLFQVMFTLQDAPIRALRLPELLVEPLEIDSGTSKFDLILTMVDRGDILRGVLEYNLDLFDPQTIDRMIEHYIELLSGLVENPNLSISELPILPQAEYNSLVNEWSMGPLVEDPQLGIDLWHQASLPESLNEFFEWHVELNGDRPAVVYVDTTGVEVSLSFDELNRKANELAHYLINMGVQADELIGLLVDRSVDQLVSILGVWKAGAAYLPLDPNYPQERLMFILEDSAVNVLLTQYDLVNNEGMFGVDGNKLLGVSKNQIDLIYLDRDWEELIAANPDNNPLKRSTKQSLAYVIYTSGSTGNPKGVMIEHGSAINLMVGLNEAIYKPISADGIRISLNAPLPFDASVQQLVMLLMGNTICIIPHDARQNGQALLEFIEKNKVELLDCVPSQLKLMVDAGLLEKDHWKPRAILPGGEAIDPQLWAKLVDAEDIDFFNMYGPTECTVDSTICMVKEQPDQPSIGRPIVGGRVYVLDELGNPSPIGVPGELYIGGAGVGRGYLQRPGLTAGKFVPDPFVRDGDGARMYRTGDRVRFLPNGNLEFLDRLDYQVKVRGFRIELGEIESCLLDHPAIKETVAIVREDRPGEKQIVAYLVTSPSPDVEISELTEMEQGLTVGELRRFLGQRLPSYMIPSHFVFLDALPLTPNAKVDRNALPEPEGVRPDLGTDLVAPRNAVEEQLVNIWMGVLGLETVGVHDNFFDLGGDSILSIQIIARANQIGMSLSPRDIFEAQTIAELALKAGEMREIFAEQGLVVGSAPLTPIQKHFFEQEYQNPSHWNQALMLELSPLDIPSSKEREAHLKPVLESALLQLLKHHDALRLRIQKGDGERHIQVFAQLEDGVPFEWVDLSELNETSQMVTMEQIADERQSSLDIENGPLLRVVYFDLGTEIPPRLLFIIHHFAIDGVSWRVLLEDFQTVSMQIAEGLQVNLPPKTTSFKTWAEGLVKFAESDEIKSELSYWLEVVGSQYLPIPVDINQGDNLERSIGRVRVVLDEANTQSLLKSVPKAFHTEINDVLVSALGLTLHSWTNQTRTVIHMEGHGRESIPHKLKEDGAEGEIDVTRTVGWFTSLFPVSLSIGQPDDLDATLSHVSETLGAIPRYGFGYGILRYLSPYADQFLHDYEKGTGHHSPQVSFNYLGRVEPHAMQSPGVMNSEDRRMVMGISDDHVGWVRSPENKREHLIDIISSVVNGELRMEWIYSTAIHKETTIQELAEVYLSYLVAFIKNAESAHISQEPVIEFQEIELDRDEFDALLDEIGG